MSISNFKLSAGATAEVAKRSMANPLFEEAGDCILFCELIGEAAAVGVKLAIENPFVVSNVYYYSYSLLQFIFQSV